jgi:ubiquinone/menaquinone biosynthesis C-methylase UbiE
MDRPVNDAGLLAEDLENLRSINRRLGWLGVVRREVFSMMGGADPAKAIEILDLATGSADYPVHLARCMRRQGRPVRILAVDNNPLMIAVARGQASAWPEITVCEMDVLSLSYPDRSFDIVVCSSALHHFSRPEAVRVLREMARLSRIGFIASDLDRSWFGAWTAWLYGRLLTKNPITRNDAYVSMLRAFTKREMILMSKEAGIRSFVVKRAPLLRLVLTGVHR